MSWALTLAVVAAVSGCATLREWFGADTLPDQAVCPQLPYYEVPALVDVNVLRVQSSARGDEYVLSSTTWTGVADNFAALLETIERYQTAISTYNAAYTEGTGE